MEKIQFLHNKLTMPSEGVSTNNGAAPDEIDRLCVHLFDIWCERRSVIPLAFLMHAWPILKTAPLARTHLLNTLQELRRLHPDSLTEEDHQIIEQVLSTHAT
jgi:hypothetical protein